MKGKGLSIIFIIGITVILVMGIRLIVHTGYNSAINRENEALETETSDPITYEVMLYDNQGNNFLNFVGNQFTITPNKVEQWGWNTDGSWTSWYDTSSVVTIKVDGNYIQSCGSTVLLKDTRLEMLEIPGEFNAKEPESDNGYTVSVNGEKINTYFGLTNWWYDMKEKGQHGEKMVLIQSQDGYNIGAFIGDNITWEVQESLPKTTMIMIDGLPLYIHRCNFTIIDSELINNETEIDG